MQLNNRCKKLLWLMEVNVAEMNDIGKTYLNILVRSVYENPESGLWVKCFIMNGRYLGTCQRAQITVFTAPIAQHALLPSVASMIGWNTWTYAHWP